MRLPGMGLFGNGADVGDVPTTRFKLNDAQTEAVRRDFASVFNDGRTLTFGPVGARQRDDGSLIVCGLVSVRNLDGRQTGMKLFDGRGTFDGEGELRFEPNRLAGANGKFLDIYGRCRNLGVV